MIEGKDCPLFPPDAILTWNDFKRCFEAEASESVSATLSLGWDGMRTFPERKHFFRSTVYRDRIIIGCTMAGQWANVGARRGATEEQRDTGRRFFKEWMKWAFGEWNAEPEKEIEQHTEDPLALI